MNSLRYAYVTQPHDDDVVAPFPHKTQDSTLTSTTQIHLDIYIYISNLDVHRAVSAETIDMMRAGK